MREALYDWVKNLAVFYIFFTALLNLAPTGQYREYLKYFMGILLILMIMMPILQLFQMQGEISRLFKQYTEQEELMEQDWEVWQQRLNEQAEEVRERVMERELGDDAGEAEEE